MGRRTLRIGTGFLPVLMSRGVHHYSVYTDAIPMHCVIVGAVLDARELTLTLESEDWEGSPGDPAPTIAPSLHKHHCSQVLDSPYK